MAGCILNESLQVRDPSSVRLSPILSSRSGRLGLVRSRWNRRELGSLGYHGQRQVGRRRPALVFSWHIHYNPRAHSTSCPHLQHDHVLDSACVSQPTDHIRVQLFLSASQWHASQDDVAVSPPATQDGTAFVTGAGNGGAAITINTVIR